MNIRERSLPTLDWNFIGTAIVIAAIGVVLIYSATWFTDPNLTVVKRQMIWVAVGVALLIAFIIVDYRILFDIAPILYGIGLLLLVYLLVWGQVTANVRSWIHIGAFQFQPSEFMKIFTALMLARYFESNDRAYLNFRSFVIAMAIIGVPVGMIAIQPDFGTAASFFPLVAVAMFFGGIRPRVWMAMILVAAISIPAAWAFFTIVFPSGCTSSGAACSSGERLTLSEASLTAFVFSSLSAMVILIYVYNGISRTALFSELKLPILKLSFTVSPMRLQSVTA